MAGHSVQLERSAALEAELSAALEAELRTLAQGASPCETTSSGFTFHGEPNTLPHRGGVVDMLDVRAWMWEGGHRSFLSFSIISRCHLCRRPLPQTLERRRDVQPGAKSGECRLAGGQDQAGRSHEAH